MKMLKSRKCHFSHIFVRFEVFTETSVKILADIDDGGSKLL
jgi:hypothetical protein